MLYHRLQSSCHQKVAPSESPGLSSFGLVVPQAALSSPALQAEGPLSSPIAVQGGPENLPLSPGDLCLPEQPGGSGCGIPRGVHPKAVLREFSRVLPELAVTWAAARPPAGILHSYHTPMAVFSWEVTVLWIVSCCPSLSSEGD